jgi:hypothetical protein
MKKQREPFSLKNKIRSWLAVPDLQAVRDTTTVLSTKENYNDMHERWLWYTADARKLTRYYENMASVPGKRDYFWCRTAWSDNKKTHTGIPKSIIDTICNVTGIPSMTLDDGESVLDDIIRYNDLSNLIKQDARPKTLVIGGGAWFVTIHPSFDFPIIEYVDERNVDIITVGNIVTGIRKRTTYEYNGRNYELREMRSYNKIEYTLYDTGRDMVVDLKSIPDTADLQPVINLNINMIPAVAMRYKNGYKNYGLSIFTGKIDLFDDIDQTASQISQVVRKSTPKTYMPSEFLEVDSKGKPITPDEYDQTYITLKRSKDQQHKPTVETVQPNMNFEGLLNVMTSQLISILTGILSPSSLGIEVQRNNNAEAMREKEKVTLVTRDDIIDNEMMALSRLLELALRMHYGNAKEYDVHVDYPDFASPAFDSVVATLLPLWTASAISPEQFVELLHGDTLTNDDKVAEIAYLKSQTMAPTQLFADDAVTDDGEIQ